MFFVANIFNKRVNHFIRQWLLLRMDATSRKLIRRARLRRSHERHARAAAKGINNKKRQGHEEQQRPEAYQHKYDSDQQLTSIAASHSTVPSLPSLSDSQSLTAKHKNDNHRRHSRVSNGCLSDSYEPPCKDNSDGKLSRGRNTSDTVVVCSRQPPALVEKPRRRLRTRRLTQPDSDDAPEEQQHSLALSRMLKQKTEELNLPDETLQEIKEMSGRLKIVNWLLDSGTVPLCAKVSTNSTYTTSSGNLVVVRSSNNWFDAPRFVAREFSPVSLNSELKSDFEEELSSLT